MIVDVYIPALVVSLMAIAGTGVQLRQFRLVLQSPRALIGGTFAQLLLLPCGALLLARLVDPAPELAAGLLLVAACPGGALSNFYCYLGRLNVSLSVMLTTISSLLAFVVLPVLLAIAFPAIVPGWDVVVPVGELMTRLLLFLLLPIALGMAIRRFAPVLIDRHGGRIRASGLLLLVLLIGLVATDQWETVKGLYIEAGVLGVLFTVLAAMFGWASGAALRLARDERYVLSIEFAIRNIGAAALVASSTLGRPEFLAFGAIFVVVQFPLVVVLLKSRPRLEAAAGT